ncbi:MAG: domain S-box protein [Solirubrobacterales bacterium]|nr:domain S-box protein [Solirubrobacterales bacterium]
MRLPQSPTEAAAPAPGKSRGRAFERRRALAGTLAGLALVLGLTALDASTAHEAPVIATVALGPFLASLVCTVRQTLAVSLLACLAAALSPLWTDEVVLGLHAVPIAVVFAGAAISVLAAAGRARGRAARRRLGLLGAIADASDGEPGLHETARRIAGILVPEVADVCVLDVLLDGREERLVVRADGPEGAAVEAALVARGARLATEGGQGPASIEEAFVGPAEERLLRRLARDEEDLAMLQGLGARSLALVPLRSRGRRVGGLALAVTDHSGRRFVPRDTGFAQALGDRVALALDNAGLSTELAEAEQRLGVALDTMAGAVLIQRPGKGIVYANQAAADSFGLGTPDAVVRATPEQISGAWDSFNEDGTPLTPDQYPSRRILTGEDLHPEPLVTHGVHRVTGREVWLVVKARPVLDEAGRVLMAVSVSEDITAVKRAELVQGLLARAGEELSASLDVDEVLARFAQLLVPDFADWCAVLLPGDDGEVHPAASVHRDPAKAALALAYAEGLSAPVGWPRGAAEVLRTGVPALIPNVPDVLLQQGSADPEQLAMLRTVGVRSLVEVPIRPATGPVLGVLFLVHAESGRRFTQADLAVAEELGRRAGVALHNAELFTERAHIAAVLQDSLLPESVPAAPGWRFAATYRPAGRGVWVGGDFYDSFDTPTGRMAVIGDVVGQGAEAAALTAQARHTLRTAAMLTGDAASAVLHLNSVLATRRSLSLCTVCAVALPGPGEGAARVVCGGHPLPIRVRGGVAEPVGAFGPMVGAFRESRFEAHEVPLLRGDVLVLFTDGVLDARRGEEHFGETRLCDALRPAEGAEDAIRRVEEALDAFQTGHQADDTALLAIERTGS